MSSARAFYLYHVMTCKSSVNAEEIVSILFIESILSIEQEHKNLVYNYKSFYLEDAESVESV